MKNQFVVILSFIFCLCACQTNVLPPEPKVDDEWIYRYTVFDESGSIVNAFDVTYVAEEVMVGTESFIHLKSDVIPMTFAYKMKPDGLYQQKLTIGTHTPFLFLKYPGVVGEEIYMAEEDGTSTITSTNASITVPAGSFSGLYSYVLKTDQEVEGNVWFNEDSWIVKMENIDSLTSDTGMYVQTKMELVNYSPH